MNSVSDLTQGGTSMTRAKRSIVVASTVGLLLGSIIVAQAQVADLFVDVGGTVRDNVAFPDGANTNRIVLAPADGTPVTYGNATIGTIQIKALQLNTPAILERWQDGAQDMFLLHNVKIVRTSAPVTNFPITFWGTAQSLPATPPSYYYNLDADGMFTSPPPLDEKPYGVSITFTTYIKPSGGQFSQYKSWTRTTNCLIKNCAAAKFSLLSYQSPSAYGNLSTSPRDLKGAITITLKRDGDTLQFNNNTGLKARSGAQLDCDWFDSIANLFRDDPGLCVQEE
jgi:hypothetical protein